MSRFGLPGGRFSPRRLLTELKKQVHALKQRIGRYDPNKHPHRANGEFANTPDKPDRADTHARASALLENARRIQRQVTSQPVKEARRNPLPYSVGPTPDNVPVIIHKHDLESARRLFKDWTITPHDLASMAGAPPGSTKVEVAERSHNQIIVGVKHPDLEALEVLFHRPKLNQKKLSMKLLKIRKAEGVKTKDVGLDVLARQVEFLSRHGVSRIELDAQGSYRNLNTDQAIGYLIWAKYGFNGKLNPGALERLRNSNLPEDAKRSRTIHELVTHSADAHEWWDNNGGSWEGKFDLTPDSDHLGILGRYIEKRITGKTLKNTRPSDGR